ncbi:MAG: polyprenyl synthetase family protein [Oscillospiraceae bacterium]|nr:polyprenyl synthetase family protein [Oscillospiraceae bacterium]
MTQTIFRTQMQNNIALIEQTIDRMLPQTNDAPQQTLLDAMRYSLSAGGKRIRPTLALEFCRLCGGSDQQVLPAACALELLHTATLIHDDMPEMDNDALRRGKPSCHVAFDPATALLAGDTLFALPFEWIAAAEGVADAHKVALSLELAKATGFYGACGGQQMDLQNESRQDVTLEELKQMYAYKTGALIIAACRMGCIAAGADNNMLELATQYAARLGLAFQIVDDILDVTSTEELLGKPIGSDLEQNKNTFVSLYGLEQAQQEAKLLTDEALALLQQLPGSDFLTELTKLLLSRKS